MLGHEAMQKMAKSNVFISGMRGLGVEIGMTMGSPVKFMYCMYSKISWYCS